MKKNGFSLIEIVLVIAITAILATVGTTSYINLQKRQSLDAMVNKIVLDLRLASDKARAQEDDLGWGIRFTNSASGTDYYEIWKGTSYATGVKTSKTNLNALSFSDPVSGSSEDIIFSKGTGLPTAAASISITNTTDTKVISIDQNGRINY